MNRSWKIAAIIPIMANNIENMPARMMMVAPVTGADLVKKDKSALMAAR